MENRRILPDRRAHARPAGRRECRCDWIFSRELHLGLHTIARELLTTIHGTRSNLWAAQNRLEQPICLCSPAKSVEEMIMERVVVGCSRGSVEWTGRQIG